MPLEIALLGAPTVRRDGELVSFDTRKATALLAHLALAERPRRRDSLCELLWPSHDSERARGALRRTLSTLRRGIGVEWVESEGDAIRLRDGADLHLDVRRFRDLAGDAATLEDLNAAVELFAGDFLEGFGLRDSPEFDGWQISEGECLRRELCDALRRLVGILALAGRYEAAIPHARRWLAVDPVHEPAHRELIRLYAATGDRGAALAQFRECVRVLNRELGVPPLAETVTLYEQVNQGLSIATTDSPVPRTIVRTRSSSSELSLVGRDHDLAALVAAYDAVDVAGGLAVIEGEAGIGKSRLANELSDRAGEQGAMVLSARCHEDEGALAYGVVVELLRDGLRLGSPDRWLVDVMPERLADASLLLPELGRMADDLPEPPPLLGPGGQQRLLEATATVIGAMSHGPEPGLVVIDDAHAADEASLDAITYLGRRLGERGLLLLLTWRSEAVPPGHRLRRLSVELAREGCATVINPSRLDLREVALLVNDAVPSAGTELEQRVYLESEGLPLFAVEYLTALRNADEKAVPQLPGEVRDVLMSRIDGLDAVARQVLGAASVVGRSFELDTVRAASGRGDEEIAVAIDDLTAAGIIRELEGTEPCFDFSHEKLRSLAYEGTGLARRRLLHGRVAEELSRSHPRGENAAIVASHLRLAGDASGAADSYRLAAEQAAALHANADAIGHLETALALGHPEPPELQERIGDLAILAGDYTRALDALEGAAAQCEPERRGVIEHKLGDIHQRRGDWERAESRFLAAIDATPDEEGGQRSRIHADLALTLHRTERSEQAASRRTRGATRGRRLRRQEAQAQAHNTLGALARDEGDLVTAANELDRSLALAEEFRDDRARAAAINNLALVCRDAGDLEPSARADRIGTHDLRCAGGPTSPGRAREQPCRPSSRSRVSR